MSEENKKTKKKGLPALYTTIAYILAVVFLLIIVPVVCPPVLGYHTYTVNSDFTGEVSSYGSVVYTKEIDLAEFQKGNLVAVSDMDDDRDVDTKVVVSATADTVTTQDNSTYSADQVYGKITAKTPFIGWLCQLCFSVIGIIITVLIFLIALCLMMVSNKLAKNNKKAKLEEEKYE